jgi:hypothetical protein
MPATTDSIVAAATREWEHRGKSTWNRITGAVDIAHTDDERDFARYIIDTYNAVAGGTPTIAELSNDDYAWSAVGMSTFMANAGYTPAEFPRAQSHSTFIRKFIRARRQNDQDATYWGYRLTEREAKPGVGDLVGYARHPTRRLTVATAAPFFDKTTGYESHTDVAVAVRQGEIDVIGANVLDSVTKKTLAIDARGFLADTAHPWFVVLKRRR